MISYVKRFIYIHIPKTAGTSLAYALRPYYPWHHRVKYVRAVSQKLCSRLGSVQTQHLQAFKVRDLAPDVFAEYFKFAFVRNPWALWVSLYFYVLQKNVGPEHHIAKKCGSFDEYLKWRFEHAFFTQSEYVLDKTGQVIVDYIGRFESLHSDFGTLCGKLNIPIAQIPYVNKSKHKDYRSYYTDSLAMFVQERLREDIKRFDYSFE